MSLDDVAGGFKYGQATFSRYVDDGLVVEVVLLTNPKIPDVGLCELAILNLNRGSSTLCAFNGIVAILANDELVWVIR